MKVLNYRESINKKLEFILYLAATFIILTGYEISSNLFENVKSVLMLIASIMLIFTSAILFAATNLRVHLKYKQINELTEESLKKYINENDKIKEYVKECLITNGFISTETFAKIQYYHRNLLIIEKDYPEFFTLENTAQSI